MSETFQQEEIAREYGFADVLEGGRSHLLTPLATRLDVLRNYANLIASGMCRRSPAARGRILARLIKYVDRCRACDAPIGTKTNCPECKKMLDDFVALTQQRYKFHKARTFSCVNQYLLQQRRVEPKKVA